MEGGSGWDLQDGVLLFAGSVVVDLLCEVVHCSGGVWYYRGGYRGVAGAVLAETVVVGPSLRSIDLSCWPLPRPAQSRIGNPSPACTFNDTPPSAGLEGFSHHTQLHQYGQISPRPQNCRISAASNPYSSALVRSPAACRSCYQR